VLDCGRGLGLTDRGRGLDVHNAGKADEVAGTDRRRQPASDNPLGCGQVS
jgi:hypothetical protein